MRKKVIIHELQAEPWGPKGTEQLSDAEQMKSMSSKALLASLKYAKATKIAYIDLWGLEWWFWRAKKYRDNRFKKIIRDRNKLL
jgi:hypothetical protein